MAFGMEHIQEDYGGNSAAPEEGRKAEKIVNLHKTPVSEEVGPDTSSETPEDKDISNMSPEDAEKNATENLEVASTSLGMMQYIETHLQLLPEEKMQKYKALKKDMENNLSQNAKEILKQAGVKVETSNVPVEEIGEPMAGNMAEEIVSDLGTKQQTADAKMVVDNMKSLSNGDQAILAAELSAFQNEIENIYNGLQSVEQPSK